MEALAAGVEGKGAVVLCNVDVQLQVGVGNLDVGALASLFPHLVNDGILHLVGDELGVAELRAEHNAIHGKGRFVGEDLRPINLLHGTIHLVGRCGPEVLDGFQNLNGGAQLEVGAIEQLLVAREGHHAVPYLNVVGSEVNKLSCQYCLQALKGLGYHLKLISHHACRSVPMWIFHLNS